MRDEARPVEREEGLVNEEQRVRLFEHLEPNHECGPHHGGCGLPHYRHNLTLPNWLENWPDYSPARMQAEQARILRDWGDLGEE